MAEVDAFTTFADESLRTETRRAAHLAAEARAIGAEHEVRELAGLAVRQLELRQRLADARECARNRADEESARTRAELDEALAACHDDLARLDEKLGRLKDATVQKLRADVEQARAELGILGERADGARVDARAPLQTSLERLALRIDGARTRLDELTHTPDEEWAEAKARYDKEWRAIEAERAAHESALQLLARASIGAPLLGLLDNWWAIALRGGLGVVLGLGALIWPLTAAIVFLAVFGIYALFSGILQVSAAVSAGARRERWGGLLLSGALGIGAGLAALLVPAAAGVVLLFVIAGWAVVSGGAEIAAAIELRKRVEDEWLLVVHGAAWIAFGILVIAAPMASALVLTLLFGAFALTSGAILLALGLRMRSMRATVLRAREARSPVVVARGVRA